MPRLGNILSDSDEIAIATPDGDIHIQYYPSRVTQKVSNQFKDLGKKMSSQSASEEEQSEANLNFYSLILHLIKSWDLEDDIPCEKCDMCLNGDQEECPSKKIVPFPLQPDRLDELPVWLLLEIMSKITDPNSKTPQKKKKN